MPCPKDAGLPGGALLFARFKMSDCIVQAMSSNIFHDLGFTPANSFVVECQNQQQIDLYWDQLGRHGRYEMCGWLADQFGVSWQIVPEILPVLMNDPEKWPQVMEKIRTMQKIDLAALG